MRLLKRHTPLFLIILFSAWLFLMRLGRELLVDWDECIFAQYTRSMKGSGNFLVNVFNGQKIFDKPPLYMWILSGFTSLFGESEFSFRVLSVLAAVAIIACVYIFCTRYFSRRTAVLASLLLLSMELFDSHAMLVNTDIFFTLFVFIGVWSWLESTEIHWLSYVAGAMFGLSVMIKGLSVIPFVAAIFLCALAEKRHHAFSRFIKLIISFVVVIAPWHSMMLVYYPKDLIHDYFYENIVKRSQFALDNHHEHWYFYFKLFVTELFPWIVFLFVLPVYLYRRLIHVRSVKEFSRVWDANRALFTIATLFFIPLLSITRVKTKISWYALPLYPFLAIVVACCIMIFLRKFSRSVMKGSLGASLVNVIFVTIVAVLAMDVGITMLHQTRVNEGKRQISYRNEVIIKAGSFPEKTLEYLVSFGERQGRAVMLPQEQLTQTWTYGGNACAVYYSKKNVNYYYNADAFVKTLKQKKGLYLIENGDLHYIESIQDKKILFKNSEYSLFRK